MFVVCMLAIGVIAVTIFGLGMAFTEGGGLRGALSILLGLSIAVKFVTAPLLLVTNHLRNLKLLTGAAATVALLMPAFAVFFPLPVAIASTAVVHLANNIFKLGLVGTRAAWPIVLRFAVPAAFAAIGGAVLLTVLETLPALATYSLAGQLHQVTITRLVIGVLIYKMHVGILWPTVIGTIVLYGVIYLGEVMPITLPAQVLGLGPAPQWILILFAYAAVASMLPVWLLLTPRGYLSSVLKIGTILVLGGVLGPALLAGEVGAVALGAGLDAGRLAINVAGPQLERSDFAGALAQVLKAYALPPASLEIEITETVIMENPVLGREVLDRIQALGVTTAIDDFGTGYSSLSRLQRLPIDSLKIDCSFVRDIGANGDGDVIVRTIIALAHNLDIAVIAEGVEHQAQLARLRELGCEYAQGYLLSRPLDERRVAPALLRDDWLREAG